MVSDRFAHSRWEEWYGAEKNVLIVHPPALESELLGLARTPSGFRPDELSFLLPMREDVTARLADSVWTRYDPYVELKNTFLEQESYVAAARHLLARHRPQLFAIYLTLVDVAEHFFWHHMEPEHYPRCAFDADLAQVVERAYRHADSTIGTFVDQLGGGYDWLVVSDHSMLPTGTIPLSGSHYRDRTLPSPARSANPAGFQVLAGLQLPLSAKDRGLGDSRRPHHRRNTSASQRPRFRRRPQATLSLVQHRSKRAVLPTNLPHLCRTDHTSIIGREGRVVSVTSSQTLRTLLGLESAGLHDPR